MDDKINTMDTDKKNEEFKSIPDTLNELDNYFHFFNCKQDDCSHNGCKKLKIWPHWITCRVRTTGGKCEVCSEYDRISEDRTSNYENPQNVSSGLADRKLKRTKGNVFEKKLHQFPNRQKIHVLRRLRAAINNPQFGCNPRERRIFLFDNKDIVTRQSRANGDNLDRIVRDKVQQKMLLGAMAAMNIDEPTCSSSDLS
ncbi:uncharacterized protein LOC130671771 [Microplitis mediator]|uniref:uncharacterized protein LOC130671771 n=1 Tax=Microplitis mediator TaxID=375433 RepID=UPI0025573B5D|nr:uncharacterized protein LOC130671771 [Microplitis mediator]